MRKLSYFLYACRPLIVFVLLEVASAFLIVNREIYEILFHNVTGSVQNFISGVKNYPFLKEENTKLLHENAVLSERLLQEAVPPKASHTPDPINHLIPASVINNSIISTKNYLTLNIGAMHGIAPGMGVVSTEGIVGKVKAVSDHFATVTSLLHTSTQISAQISNSKVLGTVRWPGNDPCSAQMLYVPRHVSVEIGDEIVTSGYNATFFAGVPIGAVKQVTLRKGASFYDIDLQLSTDFSTLQHVYVVKNLLQQEKEALEKHAKDSYE